MRLVPIRPASAGPSDRSPRILYRSTMNPGEISDKPGKDSMGMEMVPFEVEPKTAPSVAGYATVTIPAYRQQSIGVKTELVGRRPIRSTVETVGRVTYDETSLSRVNTKVGGWIEVLRVDRTGQFVRKGQPLLEIYSPDLVSTQEELRIARDNLARLEAGGARAEAIDQARGLLDDVRRRLALWDIPAGQVEALETRGTITRRVTLAAPVTGYVVDKSALEGQHVAPGEDLYRIADLRRVWVLGKVYEYQLPSIRTGQAATITLSYLPGRTFRGRVDYLYPYLDPVTRTADVRIVVDNDKLELRPEMWASVRIEVPSGSPALVVPNEAILDTGERQIAFVKRGDGIFEPRELKLGLRTRDVSEVLEGLAEGESVVTSGTFLIDSESRLKSALEGMATGQGEAPNGS
ncbi:MAG TPA: efflux RND transporter periplasmic adaptor subunit, partial [Candidatus Polarisedimenticolia bacterium]|nr:efflux RND transporter periplasmic adaptor subunit [Candidatus Polarisedimenticolia bacterium]